MKRNDSQLGAPGVLYKDTKANIEALSGVAEGAIAYATDTNEDGTYDGATWTWGRGSGSGGAFQRILDANLTIADTYAAVIAEYLDIQNYTLTLEGDAVLHIL